MSVPEGKRHKGKLEVHVKARELAIYTAKIVNNKNVFNPEIDENLVNRIKDCAYDIFAKAWSANKINADKNSINREMRYRKQEEAITLCDDMLTYIGVAKTLFHLRSKRVKYWAGQINEVRNLLQKWKESDVSRYGQP